MLCETIFYFGLFGSILYRCSCLFFRLFFTTSTMMISIYIVLSLVALVLLITSRQRRTKLRLPPGPWGLPVLGYLPWIDPKEPHESLTKLSRQYGPICGLRMGSVYTVLLSDPSLVKEALANPSITGRAPLYVTHGIMQGYGKSFHCFT